MTATLAHVADWRKAHPNLEIPEAALVTVGPFPSLRANDFVAYLQGRDRDGDETLAAYVRDLGRETAWAYDGWKKAQRDGDPAALVLDMINNASAVGEAATQYDFVRRFLRDYAAANGINLGSSKGAETDPIWLDILPEGTDMAATGPT